MKERQPMESSGIFYDSANLDDFSKWFGTKILGGATTNPVILQKEGVLDLPTHIDKMIEICGTDFPISIEVPDSSMTKNEQVELALKYQERFPGNAVIKVPMDPEEPEKAFEVIHRLGQEGIRVNATVGISMGQLIGASEALRTSKADGDNYISLFWGRRNEAKEQIVAGLVEEKIMTEEEAVQRIPDAATTLAMTLKYLKTHSLAARVIIGSVRSADQIEKAFSIGADIVTIPPKLIEEWMFTQRGADTVDEFNNAYRKVKDKMILI